MTMSMSEAQGMLQSLRQGLEFTQKALMRDGEEVAASASDAWKFIEPNGDGSDAVRKSVTRHAEKAMESIDAALIKLRTIEQILSKTAGLVIESEKAREQNARAAGVR